MRFLRWLGRKDRLYYLVFIVFLGLFWLRGSVAVDPDFGWHMRMGQIIATQGIPLTDQLSYTMPSYPVIDHEWLTNRIFAFLYPFTGHIGLAFGFAVMATLAFWLQFLRISPKEKEYAFLPVVLAGVDLFSFVGVRPQVITWLFLSLYLYILLDRVRFYRLWYLIPLIMLVWVNVHGGFAYGMALLGLATCVAVFERRSVKSLHVLILVATGVVTFCNPYGWRLWHEVWMQASDQNLRWMIQEWHPAIFSPDLPFWVLFLLGGILLFRYRRSVPLQQRVFYIFYGLMAVSSVRNVPLWVFISFPMIPQLVVLLAREAKGYTLGLSRLRIAYRYFSGFFLCILLPYMGLLLYIMSLLSEQVFYPMGAVQFLSQRKLSGNIFSFQEWNGYLTWKLPGKRVFIHGMMPSWRYHIAVGESPYAFMEYRDILLGYSSFLAEAKKYQITAVVLSSAKEKNTAVKLTEGEKGKPSYGTILAQIKSAGWKKVYEDATAMIYVAP